MDVPTITFVTASTALISAVTGPLVSYIRIGGPTEQTIARHSQAAHDSERESGSGSAASSFALRRFARARPYRAGIRAYRRLIDHGDIGDTV
jgi:hypothetical protein